MSDGEGSGWAWIACKHFPLDCHRKWGLLQGAVWGARCHDANRLGQAPCVNVIDNRSQHQLKGSVRPRSTFMGASMHGTHQIDIDVDSTSIWCMPCIVVTWYGVLVTRLRSGIIIKWVTRNWYTYWNSGHLLTSVTRQHWKEISLNVVYSHGYPPPHYYPYLGVGNP